MSENKTELIEAESKISHPSFSSKFDGPGGIPNFQGAGVTGYANYGDYGVTGEITAHSSGSVLLYR